MDAWVQRCPTCGYCAEEISKALPQAAAIVKSDDYVQPLTHPKFSELANSFFCKALIHEKIGGYADVMHAYFHGDKQEVGRSPHRYWS